MWYHYKCQGEIPTDRQLKKVLKNLKKLLTKVQAYDIMNIEKEIGQPKKSEVAS